MKLGIASKLKRAARPGALKNKVLPYLWYFCGGAWIVRRFCRLARVRTGKIVFCNFHGQGFGDHQKYIALELLRRGIPVEIVWLARDVEKVRAEVPVGIRVASFSPRIAIRELATAQFWCSNQSLDKFVLWGLAKKPTQTYIQTFHGSLGIKRVGVDVPTDGSRQLWLEMLERDSEMIDILVANAVWEAEFVYARRFFGHGDVKLFGHPRNDVFFRDASSERTVTLARLGIGLDEHVVFYAPTHRKDGRIDAVLCEFEALRRSLEVRFGGRWRVMVRLHPNMLRYADKFAFGPGVIDATRYPDMQDLLLASDVLVSDYSSCMFDFMLTRRPVFVYARDLGRYEGERGFYFPLSLTPFPVAKSIDELTACVAAFDEAKYRVGVEAFLKDKGCVEDGHATERVVDLITEILNRVVTS